METAGSIGAAVTTAPARIGTAPRLARDSVISILTTLAVQGLNVLSGVLLARTLGPGGKGLLTAVLLWPALLVAIGGLSVIEAVVYFTADQRHPQPQITATAFVIAILQAIALVAVGYALMPFVLGHYGPQAVQAGRLYLAWVPMALLSHTALAILQGKLKLVTLNVLAAAGALLTVVGLFGLYALHQFSMINILLVYLAAACSVFLVSSALLSARGWIGLTPDRELARSMVLYGVKAHGGSVAALANQRADQTLIALFLSPVSLGFYSIAVTAASPPTMLGTSLALVAFPAVSGAPTAEDKQQYLTRFVRVTLVISGAAAIVIALLAPLIINILYGRAFAPAAPVAQVLLMASVILTTSRLLSYGLKAFNQPLVTSFAEGSAAVITVFALAALLPLLGLMGAAIASLLAYSVSLASMVWFAKRTLGIPLRALLVPTRADLRWAMAQWHRRRAVAGLS